MSRIEGYSNFKKLNETKHSHYYTAYNDHRDIQYIVRELRDPANIHLRELLKREYLLIREIETEAIISPIDFIDSARGCFTVYEHFEGVPLSLTGSAISDGTGKFLKSAISIVRAVEEVHRHGIVHLGLSPDMIFIEACSPGETGETAAAITGFEYAYQLHKEPGQSHHPPVYGGNRQPVEYISPELTEKIDRVPDSRSDLYSLGIILYELLTGIPPYRPKDDLDMLHWHVAQVPRHPGEINGAIPTVISDIVMKLLEKDPDARYQSAYSLLLDLERCLESFQSTGEVMQIEIGGDSEDHVPVFSDFLYGRDEETRELRNIFESVRSGLSCATFVSGYSGVGKTALVAGFRRDAVESGALFLSGKFDQYRGDRPYSAMIEAMGEQVRRLLLLEAGELDRWRKRINGALRPNTRLVVDVIPELEFITGPADDVPEVEPSNAENRFIRVFTQFIYIFASRECPLVLFLDDLQWADRGSIRLLQQLILDGMQYVYVLGAFRSNEVDDDHPLSGALMEIGNTATLVHRMEVQPLGMQDVTSCLAHYLEVDEREALPLSRLVHRKTIGNPYFFRQFVRTLSGEGLISTDGIGRVMIDYQGIEQLPATENVVQLLSRRIKLLPERKRRILHAASCLGMRFDPSLLCEIVEYDRETVSLLLERLCERDYFYRNDDGSVSFAHDSIQESAASSLDSGKKSGYHRMIGGLLRERYHEHLEEHIFEIADHCNMAAGTDNTDEEKKELYVLNMRAAERARETAAFQAAVDYLKQAMELLHGFVEPCETDAWFDVYYGLAECLCVTGQPERAEKIINEALRIFTSGIWKAQFLKIMVTITMMKTDYPGAIDYGVRALAELNFTIDLNEVEKSFFHEKSIIDSIISERGINSLIDNPVDYDTSISLAVDIMARTSNPAYFYDPMMGTYFGLKILIVTTQYGYSNDSLIGFTAYGAFINQLFGEFSTGITFGRLAMTACKRYNAHSQKCMVYNQYINHIMPWEKHLRETIPLNMEGLQAGLDTGDYTFAGHIITHQCNHDYFLGVNLTVLKDEIPKRSVILEQTKNRFGLNLLNALQHVINNLLNKENTALFDDPGDDEIRYHNELIATKNFFCVSVNYVFRSIALYTYGYFNESSRFFEESISNGQHAITSFIFAELVFYRTLTLLALQNGMSGKVRKMHEDTIDENREKLKSWANLCPENFLCRHLLVEAERARVNSDTVNAMELYDRAIAEAREQEYIQIEMIACERAGEFWNAMNKHDFASIYLKRAHACCLQWGAIRKLRILEEAYPELFGEEAELRDLSPADVLAILKAFNVLSGTRKIDQLLDALTGIALQHSGAQRFALLMERNGHLFIESAGSAAAKSDIVMPGVPLEDASMDGETGLPVELIRYVWRTGEEVVLDNAASEGMFAECPYIEQNEVLSVMCVKHDLEMGPVIWYMENNLMHGAFSGVRLRVLELLSTQASICIENALLHSEKEKAIREVGYSFRDGDRYRIIPFEEITYLWAHGRHTIIHTDESTYDIPKLLKNIEEELPSDRFIRIHRQTVVNISLIKSLKRGENGRTMVFLSDEEDSVLNVGNSYLSALRERLGIQ
ncbi:MAG TPA: AAA family ATPase [Spirochaetota bacterium]|nr:AAA family ATPase [Spirochaetota bacterium]